MLNYVHSLRRVHGSLERELRREMATRSPDAIRVQRLKKRKLAIKDQIEVIAALPA